MNGWTADGSIEQLLQPGTLTRFDVTISASTLKSAKDGLNKNMYKALKVQNHPDIRFQLRSLAMLVAALTLSAAAQEAPVVSVSERDGLYAVAARFTLSESPAAVREVLTDYDNIPRFMLEVRRSVVVERQDQRVRVEQEAVSKYMMFSRTVHLLLDIEESDNVITFRDQFNRSFRHYDGSWTLRASEAGTVIEYQLSARPAFLVPGFVLRRLLNRDALVMIERLRHEIRGRATR